MLLQRKDEGYVWWPNYWGLFGGEIEYKEHHKKTLLREVEEEIGLQLSDIKYFCHKKYSEESKIEEKLKRKGLIYFYSAKFDGNLSKIILGEGGRFFSF